MVGRKKKKEIKMNEETFHVSWLVLGKSLAPFSGGTAFCCWLESRYQSKRPLNETQRDAGRSRVAN